MTAYEAYTLTIKENKRLSELEPIIVKDGFYAYSYARDIIKGRWLEAESVIMQDAYNAYYYSKYVIKGRWLEAEPMLSRNPHYALQYAKDILKERWPDAEKRISLSPSAKSDYVSTFFDVAIVTRTEIGDFLWERVNPPGWFAPAMLFNNKMSLLDMVTE